MQMLVPILIDGTSISRVFDATFLGTFIDDKLISSKNIDHIHGKYARALVFLKSEDMMNLWFYIILLNIYNLN